MHEARVIQPGFDLGEDRPPYYFAKEDRVGNATYPLVVPAKFLVSTLKASIDNVEAFCFTNGVDPYASFPPA